MGPNNTAAKNYVSNFFLKQIISLFHRNKEYYCSERSQQFLKITWRTLVFALVKKLTRSIIRLQLFCIFLGRISVNFTVIFSFFWPRSHFSIP